jgi:predicted transcriptional regulator
MSDEKPGLGDQELALLRFVTDRAPVTVRAAAAEFGEPRGLARTTVLTVMERLRAKGYLKRQKAADGSAWEYVPEQAKADLMRGLVREFVEKSLGGSVSPVVAYLSDTRNLTEQEKADLRAIVAGLEE